MKMVVYFDTLIGRLKELQEASGLGVPIPDDLRQEIDLLSQRVDRFLKASQDEIDSRERDKSMEQMHLLLWMTFFDNVIQKNDDYYREKFELYGKYLFSEKDHGKTVVSRDIRKKIRAIHKMLIESWPHMVPPRIEDINFPKSHLKNEMIYGSSAGEHGEVEVKPEYGFVQPPSLKPDARLLSIEEYLATEYKIDNDYIKDQKVLSFAKFAKDPDSEWCNPSDYDPTFLSDVQKKYGSKTYLDVYLKYKGLLSDYHRETW